MNIKCVLVRSDESQRQGLGRQNASDSTQNRRLAQLGERLFYMQDVTGSIPVSSTTGGGNPRVCDEHTPTNCLLSSVGRALVL